MVYVSCDLTLSSLRVKIAARSHRTVSEGAVWRSPEVSYPLS